MYRRIVNEMHKVAGDGIIGTRRESIDAGADEPDRSRVRQQAPRCPDCLLRQIEHAREIETHRSA